MNESILITGANIGLGKETARQLALKQETKKVILFCRNQVKAEEAKKELEEKTKRKIFEIIIGDVSDADSVRKAVEKIKEPIDAVILNAGGMVGKTAAKLTPSGMNDLAATNILGHVILVEELIKHDKLKKAVLSVSAEAVPGVKMLGMKPVAMKTSSWMSLLLFSMGHILVISSMQCKHTDMSNMQQLCGPCQWQENILTSNLLL